jgi:nucleobase:cation symporter-1, NCS1 family
VAATRSSQETPAPGETRAPQFTIITGDSRAEAPRTLDEPVPQVLTVFDQFGLWGNLGVSLLGFTGAMFVLQPFGSGPYLSLAAGLTAIVVGTLLGTLPVALAGVQGTRTGAPAMVLLRGLFGARLSYLPTAANIVQCVGWGVFEIVTISTAASTIAPALPKDAYVLLAGLLTALLTIRPLGAIRVLRKYAAVAVVVVIVYLLVQLLRHPLPAFTHGTWSGFWAATDTVVAVAISFAPLAADYTRHSRSGKATFVGALAGYGVTQVVCYTIGLLALVTVAHDPTHIYGAFIALPAGTLAFAILAARELDQSFADVYSTAVSIQNLRPLWDRRVLAGTISVLATAGALWLNISDYENFLTLLGSVFVPMSAVLIVDYFLIARGEWDLSPRARSRWLMLLPWAAGFLMYQLVNPGYVASWVSIWAHVASWLGFTAQSWMSASIMSFTVAAVLTAAVGIPARRLRGRQPGQPSSSGTDTPASPG